MDENKLYLVTELLTGGELFDYVVKRGTLGEDEAASILSDVGDAIRFMHDQGVIHRDLKPENLLLARESPVGFPTVKIIDFGLSKARQTRDVCASFLGTRGYKMVIDRCPRAFERHRRRRRAIAYASPRLRCSKDERIARPWTCGPSASSPTCCCAAAAL